MKKAQGLSITTIIVAAIALIVLVVLIAIFTGKLGVWGEKVGVLQQSTCTAQGYQCIDTNCAANQVQVYGFTCEDEKVCCSTRPKT